MTATTQPATPNVVDLRPRTNRYDDRDARLGAVAPLVVAAIALAALAGGLYDFSRWGLLALAMLAILAGLLIAGRIGPLGVHAPTLLAIVALAGWAAVSMLWADSADRAWTETNRLVLYGAVFAVCAATMRSRRDVHRSLAIVGAVIAGAALWTVVSLLRGDPGAFLDHRLDAPLGYINAVAGLFLIGLWPLVSLAERASHPLLAGAAVALAVIETNLLVLTQSRAIVPALVMSTVLLVALFPGRVRRVWTLLFVAAGAAAASPWTLAIYADRIVGRPRPVPDDLAQAAALAALVCALGAGTIWAAVTFARRRVQSARATRSAGIGAALAVVCILCGALLTAGDPVDRVQREWRAFTTLQVDETSSTRFTGAGGFRYDLWRVAVADARREPVLGVGAGSYGLSYYQQRRQDEPVRQPHSLPLQIVAELGIVGGVLSLVALMAAGFAIVRNRRADVAAGVAGAGMAASWATQTSFDWLYNLPGLTCIAIVGIVAAGGPTTPSRAPAGRRRRLTLIGAAALVALGAASLGRQYSADAYARSARAAVEDKPAVAVTRSARSLQLNPYAMETYYTRAAAYARLDDYPRARNALMQAAAREPLNFVPWALMGDLAIRRGEIAVASRGYRRALTLNPRDRLLRDLANDPNRALR